MSMLSASIGGTRRLVVGLGQSGLLFGPVRRAFVEPAASERDELLRLLLCHYGRRLWQVGMIGGICGNLSALSRARRSIYITPPSVNKSHLNVFDIQRVPLNAIPKDPGSISKESRMHHACYLADRSVSAVIHSHAPALTAAGIRGLEIGELLPEAELAIGGIRRLPFAPSGSQTLAQAVGDAIGEGARLLVLERHGVVTVGRSLAEAYDRMEFGELSAKTVLLAAGGEPCESL